MSANHDHSHSSIWVTIWLVFLMTGSCEDSAKIKRLEERVRVLEARP